jgi:tellurite resistance protein TehA-like permease
MTLSIILFSAVYGFLLAHDIGKAVAWGIGYICIVLTVMLLLRFWKSNDNK